MPARERFESGDIKEAIEIMQLEVLVYPDSPNVYRMRRKAPFLRTGI